MLLVKIIWNLLGLQACNWTVSEANRGKGRQRMSESSSWSYDHFVELPFARFMFLVQLNLSTNVLFLLKNQRELAWFIRKQKKNIQYKTRFIQGKPTQRTMPEASSDQKAAAARQTSDRAPVPEGDFRSLNTKRTSTITNDQWCLLDDELSLSQSGNTDKLKRPHNIILCQGPQGVAF